MVYTSTRDTKQKISSSEAIQLGISQDGGLYSPETFPKLSLDEIKSLSDLDYSGIAKKILSVYLTDFTEKELDLCVRNAYADDKFDTENKVSLSRVNQHTYFLELWHGPTCAFKDMALQLLPQLMKVSMDKIPAKDKREKIILVATSGDTGKAALEGFKDVDGMRMMVFYPEEGVSHMQKLQMITQEGNNIEVAAIKGNFDDAQTAVKILFRDEELREKLENSGKSFSSANSINWGRLAPQIVYYFAAYSEMLRDEEIELGEEINVTVPTGNFGDILAAYYAKKMGLPINKLVCASNENNVLTDFISTGIYSKNREFHQTISPSMDILISSNVERLLFELYQHDSEKISELMDQLKEHWVYQIEEQVLETLKKEFVGGFCGDVKTKETIKEIFDEYGYLCDPHTAVAASVYSEYQKESGDNHKTIIVSTANPYKFAGSVLEALGEDVPNDEFEAMKKLQKKSLVTIPEQLANLKEKPVRFSKSIDKNTIKDYIETII